MSDSAIPPDNGSARSGEGRSDPAQSNTPDPTLPAWARKRSSRTGELSEEQLALFIGPRWADTYRRKLAPFLDDPAFVPTWNWSACLCGTLWFLYRKLYLAFAAFLVLPGFAYQLLTGSEVQLTGTTVLAPENRWLVYMNLAVLASTMIAAGGSANWFLFRRARAAIRLVSLQGMPEAESARLLARIGGVNRGGVLFMLAILVMSSLAAARA